MNHLFYSYKDNTELVLDDINLTIENGEFVCIIGHSGCGKSTLLRILAGLALPTEGEVSIDHQLIRGPGTDRSVVFQHYSLFPWLTAKKNIKFGIQQAKKNLSKQQVEELAVEYLKKVGMENAKDKYPYQLSGGMQQRVAIARALAMDAEILLLDEPFGAIDAKIRRGLQLLLESLWYYSERKKNVVFVTHDIDEAIFLADRIIFMRPGKICADIKIPYARPRNQAEFIKSEHYERLKNELRELFYLEAELDENEELL
ncbi:ABC transporter ATP-binding protein [Sporomusa sp. KB1]|uniref:ABC transporter ATP-binding protein n=1 Tax=Sporomusa sp. KB1 TaxID=943346 RepID=UPI0011ABBAAC|nr:ABC transporter ATP-binding protein [Sporomusa sp. KB1]TWH51820.1 NitT/TauT family transport system ATP-binding protein [Sporomusa sp. KB1]